MSKFKPTKEIADRKRYLKSLEEDRQRRIKHANYLNIMKEMTNRYKETGSTMTADELEEFEQEERENNE